MKYPRINYLLFIFFISPLVLGSNLKQFNQDFSTTSGNPSGFQAIAPRGCLLLRGIWSERCVHGCSCRSRSGRGREDHRTASG